MSVLVQQRWPDGLRERVDAVAGVRGRTAFTVAALEKALSEAKGTVSREQAGPGPVGSVEPARPAAPSRTSVANFGAIPRPVPSEPVSGS